MKNKAVWAILAATGLIGAKGLKGGKNASFVSSKVNDPKFRRLMSALLNRNQKKLKKFDNAVVKGQKTQDDLQSLIQIAQSNYNKFIEANIIDAGDNIDEIVSKLLVARQDIDDKSSKIWASVEDEVNNLLKISAQATKRMRARKPITMQQMIARNQLPPGILAQTERNFDEFTFGKTTDKLDPSRSIETMGALERIYLSEKFITKPNAFVNFCRIMIPSSYDPGDDGETYGMFKVGFDDIDLQVDDENNFGVDTWKFKGDSFSFNALTGEFGPVMTNWIIDVMHKMYFFEKTCVMLSQSLHNNETISRSEKAILKLRNVMFSEVKSESYGDANLYKHLVNRSKDFGAPKYDTEEEFNAYLDYRKNKLTKLVTPSLAKQLHMLMYRLFLTIEEGHSNGSGVKDFILFCDVFGQPLLPFGACTYDSYRDIIENRLDNLSGPDFSVAYRVIIEPESDESDIGYGRNINVLADSFGMLFDRLCLDKFTQTIQQAGSQSAVRDTILTAAPYFIIDTKGAGPDLQTYLSYMEPDYTGLDDYIERDLNEGMLYGNNAGAQIVPVVQDGMQSMGFVVEGDTANTMYNFRVITPNGETRIENHLSIYAGMMSSNQYLFNFFKDEDNQTYYTEQHFKGNTVSNDECANIRSLMGSEGVDSFAKALATLGTLSIKTKQYSMWMSDVTYFTSRMMDSGQVDLSFYLFSDLLNVKLLDLTVDKYNIPIDAYPSQIKKKLSKQQKEYIEKKYVNPRDAYAKGTKSMREGSREFAKYVYDRAVNFIRSGIYTSRGDAGQDGTIQNASLKRILSMPMNQMMQEINLLPESTVGKDLAEVYKTRIGIPRNQVEIRYFRADAGSQCYISELYYLTDKQYQEMLKSFTGNPSKIRTWRSVNDAAVARVEDLPTLKGDPRLLRDGSYLNPRAIGLKLESTAPPNTARHGDDGYKGASIWVDTYDLDGNQVPFLDLRRVNDFHGDMASLGPAVDRFGEISGWVHSSKIEGYKNFKTTTNKMRNTNFLGVMSYLSKVYSVTTQQISNQSFSRFCSVVLGGDILSEHQYGVSDKTYDNIFEDYFKKLQDPNSQAVSMQMYSRYGINLTPTMFMMNEDAYSELKQTLVKQEVWSDDPGKMLNNISRTVGKFLKGLKSIKPEDMYQVSKANGEEGLNPLGYFGVPVTNRSFAALMGKKASSNLIVRNAELGPRMKLRDGKRNGLSSIYGYVTEANNIAKQQAFAPQSEVSLGLISKQVIDSRPSYRLSHDQDVPDYIQAINLMQNTYNHLLMELMINMGFSSDIADHLFVGDADHIPEFFVKCKTINGELNILKEDPLGLREFYFNLRKDTGGAQFMKFNQNEVKSRKLDPNQVEAMSMAGESSLDAQQLYQITAATRNQVVLRTVANYTEQVSVIPVMDQAQAQINESQLSPNFKISFKFKGDPSELDKSIASLGANMVYIRENNPDNDVIAVSGTNKANIAKRKQAWQKQFDEYGRELLADDRLQKLIALVNLKNNAYRAYGIEGVQAIQDANWLDPGITSDQINVMNRRFIDYPGYRRLHGDEDNTDYKEDFIRMIRQQVMSGPGRAESYKYQAFRDGFNEKQKRLLFGPESKVLGAFIGTLQIGPANIVRVYMPYNGEHVRNVGRATSGVKDNGYDRKIPFSYVSGNTKGKFFSNPVPKVAEIDGSISTAHGPCHMCIGSSDGYTTSVGKTELHFALVDMEGYLVQVLTLSINPTTGIITGISQHKVNSSNQPHVGSYAGNSIMMRELSHKTAREFYKLIYDFVSNPQILSSHDSNPLDPMFDNERGDTKRFSELSKNWRASANPNAPRGIMAAMIPSTDYSALAGNLTEEELKAKVRDDVHAAIDLGALALKSSGTPVVSSGSDKLLGTSLFNQSDAKGVYPSWDAMINHPDVASKLTGQTELAGDARKSAIEKLKSSGMIN